MKALTGEGEVALPITIETHNVFPKEVRKNKEQDFDLILECASKSEVYEDGDAYDA